jgi:hypothetical protein
VQGYLKSSGHGDHARALLGIGSVWDAFAGDHLEWLSTMGDW